MTKSKLVYFDKYVEEKFTIEGSGIRNSSRKPGGCCLLAHFEAHAQLTFLYSPGLPPLGGNHPMVGLTFAYCLSVRIISHGVLVCFLLLW